MEQGKPGWRSAAFGPLTMAVLLTVLYKIGDGYVMGHLIGGDDKLLATLVYLTLGAVIGLAINYILCQTPLGRVIDSSYRSINGIPFKAHKYSAAAGVLSAFATGIYLWSFRTLDPSLVVPLTSLSVFYIALGESIKRKLRLGAVLPSIVLVVLGVGLASFRESANWAVTGEVLLVVLFVHNLANAASELIGKAVLDKSDAVSYSFWRFAWLTAAAIVIAVVTSVGMGKFGDYLQLFVASFGAIPVIALVMVVVFFANAWGNRGMAISDATRKNLVMTGTVVVSIFATALVAAVWPNVFPSAPVTMLQWTLRLVGAALLMWGVLRLRKE